jgi:hypothetical protein
MLGTWVQVALPTDQTSSAAAAIRNKCERQLINAHAPDTAALFEDADTVSDRTYNFYFSPIMADLCRSVIAPYNPVATGPPSPAEVKIFIANGDASALLRAVR